MVNNNNNIFIKRYMDEGYYVYFNKSTGVNVRCEFKENEEPFWSKHGPELIDISITKWCDKGCEFCYRNSNKRGKHMKVGDFEEILRQAVEMDTLQVALGGGNPNQHPDFIKFLKLAREKYGIVPSYTTNGRGLTSEVLDASKKYCGAVAVSAYEPYSEMKASIDKLLNKRIKTNIHFVLTSSSVDIAIDWLENLPNYLDGINAIVFLNYKPVGRNILNKQLLLKNNKKFIKLFSIIENKKLPFKIGFDSCSISGLVNYMNIKKEYIESCESGRFSAFISEDFKLYPCSFMIGKVAGVDLKKEKIIDAWRNSQQFNAIRGKIENNNCVGLCEKEGTCNGGCPIFKNILLCDKK